MGDYYYLLIRKLQARLNQTQIFQFHNKLRPQDTVAKFSDIDKFLKYKPNFVINQKVPVRLWI